MKFKQVFNATVTINSEGELQQISDFFYDCYGEKQSGVPFLIDWYNEGYIKEFPSTIYAGTSEFNIITDYGNVYWSYDEGDRGGIPVKEFLEKNNYHINDNTKQIEYTTLQKQKVLLDLLKHFKNLNDKSNKSLADFGESKFASPFESISVRDIKDYAFKEISGCGGWEEF